MRSNIFGERILTPGDDRDVLNDILMNNDVDVNETLDAEIFAEKDETYLFGGEIADPSGEVRITFDGFDSIDACRSFLNSLDITDQRVAS